MQVKSALDHSRLVRADFGRDSLVVAPLVEQSDHCHQILISEFGLELIPLTHPRDDITESVRDTGLVSIG